MDIAHANMITSGISLVDLKEDNAQMKFWFMISSKKIGYQTMIGLI